MNSITSRMTENLAAIWFAVVNYLTGLLPGACPSLGLAT